MNSYRDFASVYDRLMSNANYEMRATCFDRLIQTFSGKKGILLDLACGTGSMSLEFSRLGYDVIGVDSSEEMLSQALEKKLDAGDDSVIFLCQLMQELDLYGTIDCTVSALDSLNHLTEADDLQETLCRVSLFTNPGGLFLFDVNTPYKHRKTLKNNTFIYDEPGVFCVWQNTQDGSDPDLIQMDLDLFFEQEDGTYTRGEESFCERAYSNEVLQAMLKEAGFETLSVFDEDGVNPPYEHSERVIYVAKKLG